MSSVFLKTCFHIGLIQLSFLSLYFYLCFILFVTQDKATRMLYKVNNREHTYCLFITIS